MTPAQLRALDRELSAYLQSMVAGMGRVERRHAMELYLTGLLLDGDRKSTQPMAIRLAKEPGDAEALRQRLQQCVSIAPWSEDDMYRRLALKLEKELPEAEAMIVDDTGFPKKGEHSVGVARQYSGTLGRVDNCQVAVSLHLAGERGSGCIAMRLYLSEEEWASDARRRKDAGVPKEVRFLTKWEISLLQIRAALASGVRKHVVLADAGYGDVGAYRSGLTEQGLEYVVAVNGTPVLWPPDSKPSIPLRKPGSGGHSPTRYRDELHPPETVASLAPKLHYRNVVWREGSRGRQSSRFAAVRVRTAHRHLQSHPPGQEQWLLCEWPRGEPAPTKHWLSTTPAETSLRELVRLAKLRWRVERDYQEMKQEVGLDHFEGRTWRGFHHHAALCSVAHAFLALRRALSPPIQTSVDAPAGPTPSPTLPAQTDRDLSTLPRGHRPSGPTTRTFADVIR